MESGELIVGFVGGLIAAIAGSYVSHRYSEQLESENRRIRTNNVLRAIATEIRVAGELYNDTFKGWLECCYGFFPRVEEAITGVETFRQNLELITSQTESSDLVGGLIEMDYVWRLFSAELRINNTIIQRLNSASGEEAKDYLVAIDAQASKIKEIFHRLEKKGAEVVEGIDSYLANSKRTSIQLIPEEWSDPPTNLRR